MDEGGGDEAPKLVVLEYRAGGAAEAESDRCVLRAALLDALAGKDKPVGGRQEKGHRRMARRRPPCSVPSSGIRSVDIVLSIHL